MIWKRKNNALAPANVVATAAAAAAEFDVPVGVVLGIIECECDFRAGLVSSAGAVGYMQIKRCFAADYYRYAGFEFDLEGLEGIRGCTAALKTYQKWGVKKGYSGADAWRYVLCVHRYGQNAVATHAPAIAKRVLDVEAHMKRNGVWYNETSSNLPVSAPVSGVPAKAVKYATEHVGCAYSQPNRAKDGIYDCSSLVARAYKDAGYTFTVTRSALPRSNEEVYDDNFRLLYPATYADIGKRLGGKEVSALATQAGDLQFLRTSNSSRANKITHVTMVADSTHIVHARGTKYGVRTDNITLYAGKICALTRYDPACPLVLGHKGNRVKELQRKLNALGAGLVADGDYGAKTLAAVEKFGVKE